MRYTIITGFAIVAILASLRSGRAENNDALRLADVLEQAREQNPEIRAAQQRAEAAAAIPRRVSALDDPMFSYEAWNAPESLRIDKADNSIFRLSQKMPFPGKRALAGAVAERDAEMARREAEGVTLDVVTAVKRAYFDLYEAYARLDIYSSEKALVQRFARIAEQKYGVGTVSQADALRAQVELTRLINRVTTQTLAIESARAELNALLSRSPVEPLARPEDPAPPRLEEKPESLEQIALEHRPELAMQAAVIGRDEKSVELARRNYLPDFEFSLARFVNYGQNDGFGAMVSVSIPLAYRGKYDAEVAENSARLAAAQADRRRIEDRIRREVQQAYLRARTALLQHELFVTTHIPQAEQTLRVAESAYGTGAMDFLSLIDSARSIEMVHLEHIEAAAEFERAFADLERATGTDLRDEGGTGLKTKDED